MASEPKKPEHVRETNASESREGRASEGIERAGNQVRDAAARTGEAAERTGDQVRDAAGQTGEAVKQASVQARESADQITGQARDAAKRAVAQSREVSANLADTVQRTTDAAFEITQRAADQGREAVWQSVRAAAGVQHRLADVGYGRSHQLFGSTARMIEVYREASENAAGNVQALLTSYLHLGRGMQEMQQAYFDLLDRAVERTSRKRQDLLRAKSVEEFARVQRDMYVDTVDRTLEATVTLLQLGSRAAQEALRPLQNRGQFARV